MDDVIYRQDAIEAMNCLNDSICEGQATEALCELPSVDAVEVVRCKDCINRYRTECSMKYLYAMRLNDTDFCSLGERKTDEC